jgi:hypothetical protein
MGKTKGSGAAYLFLALVFILLAAGCGGGGGGGGSTDDGGGAGSESYTEMASAMDAVDAKMKGITTTDPDERVLEIVQYLSTRPEFVASGISESTGSAWARTKSGTVVCFVDKMLMPNLEPKPAEYESASGLSLSSAMDLVTKAIAENRIGLPGGTYGFVATVHETKEYWDSATGGIWGLVNSPAEYFEYKELFEDNGSTGIFKNCSIERLAATHDVGVFYMKTLVGAYKKPDDTEIVALMTSTEVTPSSEATYHSLLQDGLLVIMDAPPLLPSMGGDGYRQRRFAITTKFIREKIRLSTDSMVYIDAGFGDHQDLKDAFSSIGADVYFSWKKMPCDIFKKDVTAHFLFHHLMPQEIGFFLWPHSSSRPFDYGQVHQALYLVGMGRDKCGNTIPSVDDPQLVFTEGSGTLANLAPSIRYLVVDENPADPKPEHSILHVYGSFGPDPGAGNRFVSFRRGGEPMELISWSPTEITCWIPSKASSVEDSQSRTAGVVFVHRRGIASNGVPLTEWILPVRMYSSDPNTTFWSEANFTLHLRLDVHGWRDILNQPYPLATPPESLYNGGATGYQTSAGRYSTGSWSCGGSFHDTGIHYTVLINGEEVATSVSDTYYAQSGSGSLIYQNDIAGMYATVVAYHDPVTLEKPTPPAKFRVNLRYMSQGPGVTFYVDNQYYSQHYASGNWTFDLEVDYDDKDEYGNLTYAIKAGTHDQLSWPKTKAVLNSRPDEYTPH